MNILVGGRDIKKSIVSISAIRSRDIAYMIRDTMYTYTQLTTVSGIVYFRCIGKLHTASVEMLFYQAVMRVFFTITLQIHLRTL